MKLGPDLSAKVLRCSPKAYSFFPLYKSIIASGGGEALMLTGVTLMHEDVHAFPVTALSPGDEFRNDGGT